MATRGDRGDGLEHLVPDPRNANKGTERGRAVLEASLREVGAGRSIVVDKYGRVIAGNKTLEAWAELSEAVEVVHTTGDTLVVVQRDDLDLAEDTGPARRLAYFDNRAGEVGLDWHVEQIAADLAAGVDFSSMFTEKELTDLVARAGAEMTPPSTGSEPATPSQWVVIVQVPSEAEQVALCEKLQREGYHCRIVTS